VRVERVGACRASVPRVNAHAHRLRELSRIQSFDIDASRTTARLQSDGRGEAATTRAYPVQESPLGWHSLDRQPDSGSGGLGCH
jgi:hypothetical protein